MAGCTGHSPAADSASSSEAHGSPFLTDNGLLYPPELWGALEPSTAAAVLQFQVEEAVGSAPSWHRPLEETLAALSVELNPTEGAFLLLDTGIADATTAPWTAEDLRSWWKSAVTEKSVDHMWMVAELAAAQGQQLAPTPPAVSVLEEAAAESESLPAELASELLVELVPGHAPVQPASPKVSLRTARDAAQLLFRRSAGMRGDAGDDRSAELRDMAESAAAQDDWSRSYLVRAYATAGRIEEARRVARTFDQRRRQDDGEVLEPLVFVGSVGSTFRMLQLVQEGNLTLDATVRGTIKQSVRERLDVDLSHAVAGTAALAILEPNEVPVRDREAVIAQAMQEEVGAGALGLELEQAMSWSALAPYAVAMDVDLAFPGLSGQAIQAWTAEEDAVVTPSVTQFLLALADTGQLNGQNGVPELTGSLQRLFAQHQAADLGSEILFGGALAVHAATGAWPYEAAELRRQLDLRRGACLGGFDGFVRDAAAEGSPCNANSTRYAGTLSAALGPA